MPKRPVLMFVAVFSVCFALTEYLAYQQYRLVQENRRIELTREATEAKDRLRNILFNDIAAANTLAVIYKQYGVPARFDSVARQIIQNSRYAEGLQISENGIVKNVYAGSNYKSTIGSNINEDTKRKAEEVRAIEKKDIYFAGPRRLKFGDTGIVGKVPVIVNDKVPAVITVLTRLPALKKAIAPGESKHQFAYQLLKIQGKDTLAFPFSNTIPDKSRSVTVKIPEGDWLLCVAFAKNFKSNNLLYELSGLGLFFSLVCGLLAYRKAQEPYTLKKIIDEKTNQLSKSEKYFRTLIETSSDAVVLMNSTGYVLYQSPSAEKILGYSLSEIQHIDGITLIHPDDREKDNRAFYKEISEPGAIVPRSHRIKHKNGNYIYVEGTYRNLLHDDSINAIVYTYEDVTEKILSEKALLESEVRFRSIFEDSTLGMGLTSVKHESIGKYLKVNRALCEMLGYTEEELLSRTFMENTHPDDLTTDLAARNSMLQGVSKNYWIEKRYVHKNGNIVWANVHISVIKDNDNQPIYMLAQVEDITEKIKSRNQLAESEDRFRRAFEDSAIGMGLTSIQEDSMGRWLKVNRSLYEMLGYTKEELLARTFLEITHPDDLAKDLAAQDRILRGEADTYRIEKRYIHKNGSFVWINLNVSGVKDNDNQVIYLVAQVENITERILSQQKIVRYNHELTLLNRINDVILRTNTELSLYQEACDCLVNNGLYKLTWVCIKPDNSAPDRVIKPIAAAGDIAYLSEITIDLNDPKTSNGPTGTALLTQKAFVNNDANNAPYFTSWIKQAQNHGISASIAIPLFLGDDKTGALTIYSTEKNAFDDDEVSICERIAANLSIAVQNIKSRIEKEKAQYLLHERVKEISTIHAVDTILQREVVDKTILMQDIVEILPTGWQYPDICAARILFDGKEYKTKNYTPTTFNMTAGFCLSNERQGTVEVLYTQLSPVEDEGPFFKEERQLLTSIVDTIKIHLDKFIQQAALTESENRFRRAFEDSAIGMGISGIHGEAAGRWIKVNQPLCNMLGYTEDELLSLTFTQITHADDLDKSFTSREGALNGVYETYQIEKRYLHKNGNPVWANVHVSVVKDNNNQPMYLIAQIEDITERLEAQNTLAESENRFRRAFEDSAIGMGLKSLDPQSTGKFLKVNKSLCEMLGYTESDLLSRTFMEITHPDDLKTELVAWRDMVEGKYDTFRMEKRYLHKNGGAVWANLNISVIKNKDDQPLYLVIQAEDITEKRESQVKFQSLVEESIVGVYILQDEKVVYVNPRLLQESGYTEDEIKDMPIDRFVYIDDHRLVKDMMSLRTHEGLSSVRYEARIKHKNGTPIWYEFFGSTTIYKGAPALIGTMVNMTERKAAEREINRLTRLYQFMGSINEAMLKAKNIYQVYAEACRIAIAVGGFRMAWIGVYNEKNDSITPVAWNGHENGFLNRVNVAGVKVSTSALPSARAIRQKSHFYYNDIANDTEIPKAIRAEMVKQQYLSGLSFPIFIEGKVVAALVLLMSEPFFFNEGEIKLLQDVTDNITYALEKIRIQTLQNRSDANLRSVFDNTHVAYLMLDTNYNILSLNQRMRDIYINLTNTDLKEGMNIVENIIPEKRENARSFYNKVIEENRPFEYETVYTKNGETLHFLANVTPIYDGKSVTGLCISSVDITEQKKLTEKLLDHVNAIERQNEKLREIAWMQSHVIRAPLARIMGLIDLINNHATDDSENKTILDYILISANELDDVIKNITHTVYEN